MVNTCLEDDDLPTARVTPYYPKLEQHSSNGRFFLKEILEKSEDEDYDRVF